VLADLARGGPGLAGRLRPRAPRSGRPGAKRFSSCRPGATASGRWTSSSWTSGGGTWRSGDVIDYATKTVLAGPVTATQTHRDAIASVQLALDAAAELLGRPLLEDLTDPSTREVTPIFLVTDNGPCFKAAAFARFIASRPELTHIRTRKRSPQTNGVIERYHGAIKIEQLWRQLSADGNEMTTMVADFRELYNHVRPHENLAGDRPIERYLAPPDAATPDAPNATLSTRQTVRIP